MSTLDSFKGIVDDAFRDAPFNLRQDKAAPILSEARKHLSKKDLKELENYVFDRLS